MKHGNKFVSIYRCVNRTPLDIKKKEAEKPIIIEDVVNDIEIEILPMKKKKFLPGQKLLKKLKKERAHDESKHLLKNTFKNTFKKSEEKMFSEEKCLMSQKGLSTHNESKMFSDSFERILKLF